MISTAALVPQITREPAGRPDTNQVFPRISAREITVPFPAHMKKGTRSGRYFESIDMSYRPTMILAGIGLHLELRSHHACTPWQKSEVGKMHESRPLFIVSAPRSGSTLLRLILDTHPQIAVPPPGWLFDLVYPYLYSYGDLSQEANIIDLAEDVLATPTVKKWPIQASPASLVAAAKSRSFAGLYGALHEAYAALANKKRWGEKTPRNAFWIDEIRQNFPNAQIIHIVRDGRDMAIDISDSMLLPYSVYAGANVWQRYVRAIRESASRLPASAFAEIRYEDLCANPEAVIRRLCEFIGEDFDVNMLSPNRTKAAQQWSTHPLHAKTSQPISARYCEMYKSRLPKEDVAALEALIGDSLALFGYPVAGDRRAISERLATQFIESDTVTNPENVSYRKWHEDRRKQRRDKGVWKPEDRTSLLWGMN
jgi:hypothetical protein